MSHHLHRFLLYAAIFAALLQALSATVSYVKASADGVQVVEVCSSFGIERIHVDADGNPVEAPEAHSSPYCDYCVAGQLPVFCADECTRNTTAGAAIMHRGWVPNPRLHIESRPLAHSPRAPPMPA